MVQKQYLVIGIYKIVRSTAKLSVFLHLFSEISHFFSEKFNFCSQHTSCVTYYDDIINCDITKAFGNWSRNKHLKPKNIEGGGGGASN